MSKLVALLILLQSYQVFCQHHNNQCSCVHNCSTVSQHITNRTLHYLDCSIQTLDCITKHSGPKRIPSEPKDKTNNEAWYLYNDPKKANYQKIALNFSWGPKHDTSVDSLQGYKITLYGSSILHTSVYFCMNHTLDFFRHVHSTFFYDCFGKCDDYHFKPGQRDLNVFIRSLPIPQVVLDDRYLQFSIDIPSCDDPRMALVYECQQLKAYLLLGNVSCANNSFIVDYNVPPLYGTPANLRFSKDVPGRYGGEEIGFYSNLKSNGHQVLQPPSSNYLNDTYTVQLWGDFTGDSNRLRKKINLSFQSCPNRSNNQPNNINIPVGIIVGVLLIIILVVGIVIAQYFLKWNVSNIAKWYQRGFQKNVVREDINGISRNGRISTELEKGKKKVKVYLIFVNDHSKHQKIILHFASFLQADLGFDVLFELFQSKDIWADPITWMEKSLEESDKVIVIWSPGATKRWNDYNNRETADHDLFTPVLKNIKKDMFCDRNVGKYYFGYFEYCTKEDIPVEFKKSSIFHFKLMKQFEELYFRLKGMEMYMPGAVVREEKIAFDRYFDPKLTKYGPKLEQYICEMCAYAKENSDWHLMNNKNDVDINVAVVGCKNQNRMLMSNNLNIVPPVPIANLVSRDNICYTDSHQCSLLDKSVAKNPLELTLLNQEVNLQVCIKGSNFPSHSQLETAKRKSASSDLNCHGLSRPCPDSIFLNSDFDLQRGNNRPIEHEVKLSDNNTLSSTQEQPNFVENDNASLTKSDNLKYASLFTDYVNEVAVPNKYSHSSNNDETGYWSLQSSNEKRHPCYDSLNTASSFCEPSSSAETTSVESKNDKKSACSLPIIKLAPLVMDEDPMALLTSINQQNGFLPMWK